MNDYEKSCEFYILEQENIIKILKVNEDYLINELELKKEALDLVIKNILHEEKALSNFKNRSNND